MNFSDRFQKIIKSCKNAISDRKNVSDFFSQINWKSPKALGIVLLISAVILSGGYYLSQTTSAVSIVINGHELGYAPSQAAVESMIEESLDKEGNSLGLEIHSDDEVQYISKRISKDDYRSNLINTDVLLSMISTYVEGYAIKIDGNIVAVLPHASKADEVLSEYIEYQTKPSETNKVVSAQFEQKVEKTKVKVKPQEVSSVEETLKTLIAGNVTVSEYAVQEDDSLWLIARTNNMLVDEIIQANPGLSEDSILHSGQVIKLSKAEPYLTVISKGEKVVKETIPFDVITQRDSSLGYGKSVIRQDGKDGEKAVTYAYTEENGKIIEKTVLEEEVLAEPTKQIIARGPDQPVTVAYSSSRGSGDVPGLVWPLSGKINSYYGYRYGGFHTGIDIDGDTGQPYVAAAAGKVVQAGWSGNYGYMIVIDHGNGVITKYAHSSKLAVSAGQQVNKGQVIGYVGSTGRSTGPHLHLEIIINGNTTNPLNYL